MIDNKNENIINNDFQIKLNNEEEDKNKEENVLIYNKNENIINNNLQIKLNDEEDDEIEEEIAKQKIFRTIYTSKNKYL